MMSEVHEWDGNLPLEIIDRSGEVIARFFTKDRLNMKNLHFVQGVVMVYDGCSDYVKDQVAFGGYDNETGEPFFDIGVDDKGGRTRNLKGFPNPSQKEIHEELMMRAQQKIVEIGIEEAAKMVRIENNDEIPF